MHHSVAFITYSRGPCLFLPRSLGPVDEGLADFPNLEDGRRLHVVPVLARERVHNLLLGAFLAGLEALRSEK